MDTTRWFLQIVRTGILMALLASATWAKVTTIDANVSAMVQEFVGGELLNSDLAVEDYEETTGNLPLRVETRLTRDNSEEEEAAGAMGTTIFYDPRLAQQPDPDEFGIDLAAYSLLEGVTYDGMCEAIETREIVFTNEDIALASGTEVEARSFFFLDGIIILWTDAGVDDLSGADVNLWVQIEQDRGDESLEVLSARLQLAGQTDGSAVLTTDGALLPENVVVQDISEDIPDLGRVHLLIIPNMAIPYQYNAAIDETFTLRARVDAEMDCAAFTGASVQLGVPLLELIEFINNVSGGVVSDDLQQDLEDAIKDSPAPLKPLDGDRFGTELTPVGGPLSALPGLLIPLVCGSLAVESVLGLMLFAFVTFAPRTWRRKLIP